MHPTGTDPEIGWVKDEDTYDNGVENDKQMHNRGWIKAPDSYYYCSINDRISIARGSEKLLRKIIHRQYIDKGEHWLRLRYLPSNSVQSNQRPYFFLDYIELVPLHIVSDPNTPEDRH